MVIKQLLFSAGFAVLAMASCKEAEETNSTAVQQAETDAMLVNTSVATPGANAAQPATVVTSPAGQNTNATQGSTQAAKTVAAVNPPHGEPGHRCDIAVGAPLDAPAGNAPAATEIKTSPAPAAQPASGGSGRVNPPHGQPGHDCTVAVGAPLP